MISIKTIVSTKQTVILATAIAVLSLLYTKSTAVDPDSHLAFVSTMRSIKQLDTDINQNILKSRHNLILNYDSLIKNLDLILDYTQRLRHKNNESYLRRLNSQLNSDIILLVNEINLKIDKIEKFKTSNAVLNNSLRYFPFSISNYIKQCQQSVSGDICNELTHLERDVLLLNIIGGRDFENRVQEKIRRINKLQSVEPLHFKTEILPILNHAHTIIDFKNGTDSLTTEILSSPVQKIINNININYDIAHKDAMSQSGYYRATLYGFAVLLLVYAFYSFARLKLNAVTLTYQANHDELTGMANRSFLYRQIDVLANKNKFNHSVLILIDLDRFKEVNDALGHHAGDQVLQEVAKRLYSIAGDEGIIARLGGDEFAIYLFNVTKFEDTTHLVTGILNKIRQPINLHGLNLENSASIGVAFSPQHGKSASQLMRCADVAMYQAKNKQIGFTIYDTEQDQYNPRRLAIMTGLTQAIEKSQFFLHFQPKVSLYSGKVTGLEALIRWQHPEYGSIRPDEFIPLAELSEIITPLTLWVVDQALMQVKNWKKLSIETSIAVNFSARNFIDDSLPDKLRELFDKHQVPYNALEIEITESAIMADPKRSMQIMQKIHDMGVILSIDDFGTGQSSLAYLQRLPIQSLKIDRSFIADVCTNSDNATIVQSTIHLAKNLGLRVIAEGVEDVDTFILLCQFGCDEAQGYWVSRPVDNNYATQWLQHHQPDRFILNH